MSRIKIILIITGLNTGGAEMMLYKTIKHMDRSNYDLIVVSLFPKGRIAKYIEKQDVPVYSLNLTNSYGLLKAIRKLVKIVKEHNPMILHAYMFHADMMARIVGRILKVPIVISSIRNENIGGKKREILTRFTDFLTDHVTVVCKSAADRLIKSKVIKENKTTVIYNGVELHKTWRSSIDTINDKRTFDILAIGRLHPQKNFPLLINSVAKLVNEYPYIRVSIAGEGESRKELENLINKLDLNSHITLLGVREDVKELLHKCDLFILPSSWEGMPNVVLEAMAAYKPVIATDVGGTSEIIIHNKSGILIPPNDKNKMIESIRKILKMSIQERNDMGLEGRRRVEKMFDINKTVKETESIYKKLLNKLL